MSMELTYPEVGATAGPLPAGYHHLERQQLIGTGRARFQAAGEQLLTWQMHRGAGLRVDGGDRIRLGEDAVVRLRLGPLRFRAPVRIVAVIEEPTEIGFAYGTLPGHPEIGEERFSIHLEPDDTVLVRIRAFSRPGRWFTRLGGPVGRLVQQRTTQRYLDAFDH